MTVVVKIFIYPY